MCTMDVGWPWLGVLALFSSLHRVDGDHYRGAMMYWKQSATDSNLIDLDYRQAWRRDWKMFHPMCDNTEIAKGSLFDNGNEIDILSERTGSGLRGPFTFQCTDYSVNENWVTGKGRIQFMPSDIDTSSNLLFARFYSCCWIQSVLDMVPKSYWSVIVSINTTVRSDTGRMNTSPRVDMAPLVRLQFGCNHTIKIPVSDEDGDDVRCRWAKNASRYDECAGACGTFTGATIDERSCTISYNAHYGIGWYAVAIQIEDFTTTTSTAALSSVPLQFLVSVEQQSGSCATYQKEKPTFIGLTLPDSACVGVHNGTDFSTDIYIDSKSNSSITELNTVSPIGLIKSSLQRLNASDTWHINVKWNPNRTDTVNNVFCFTAVDTHGVSSEQRCITLLAGVPPAAILPSSKTPSTSVMAANQHAWSIEFDQFAKPASRPAFIYLYLANGTLVETVDVFNSPDVTYANGTHGTVLTFHSNTTLQPGQEYYLLFGQGLVQGHSYCGAESAAMLNSSFWRFSVYSAPATSPLPPLTDSAPATSPLPPLTDSAPATSPLPPLTDSAPATSPLPPLTDSAPATSPLPPLTDSAPATSPLPPLTDSAPATSPLPPLTDSAPATSPLPPLTNSAPATSPLPPLTGPEVQVVCERQSVSIPCDKADLNCTETWRFPNPCTPENRLAGKTRFAHPTSTHKFLLCDLTGKVYIALCPQGEIFYTDTNQCAAPGTGQPDPCSASPTTGQTLFPHCDPHKYIHCGAQGQMFVQSCQMDYVFLPGYLTCVPPGSHPETDSLLNTCGAWIG